MAESTPANLIIGLSGKARSGKDTAAMMLKEAFPGIHFTGFSLPMKEAFDAKFGTNTRHDEDEKDRYRKELNEFSFPILAEDPTHWVRIAIAQEPPLLFKDVRLLPEAEAIKEKQGLLIRIEIDPEIMKERWGEFYGEHHAAHISESALDDYKEWDFVIHNNGTLEDLQKEVNSIVSEIRKRYA